MHIRGTQMLGLLAATGALLASLALPQPAVAQPGAASCAAGYALWANDRSRPETLVISGSDVAISGAARSNADVRISGSSNRISGAVEYVTLFRDGGDQNRYPAPMPVAATDPPLRYALADYQPGGASAEAARSQGRYTLIGGDLDISEPRVLDGLYYVRGNAKLAADDIRGTFTIVAEGMIDVSGSRHDLSPYADGLLLLSARQEVGAALIKLAGSNSELRGVVYAPGGTVELSGSASSIRGVVLGNQLKLSGSALRIAFAAEYCASASAPEQHRLLLPNVSRL